MIPEASTAVRPRPHAFVWVGITTLLLGGMYLGLEKPPSEPHEASAHADHTPRHGGLFFMAPNGFHHVEGTLNDGEFRLYLYDNFTRPMDARLFRARVGNRWLESERRGGYLRLQLDDRMAGDSRITAFIRFAQDRPEDRFDFVFSMLTPQPR